MRVTPEGALPGPSGPRRLSSGFEDRAQDGASGPDDQQRGAEDDEEASGHNGEAGEGSARQPQCLDGINSPHPPQHRGEDRRDAGQDSAPGHRDYSAGLPDGAPSGAPSAISATRRSRTARLGALSITAAPMMRKAPMMPKLTR